MNIAAHLALFESAVAATQATSAGEEIAIDIAMERAAIALRDATCVVVIGNGGSAAIASHVANDLMSCGVPAITLTDPSVMTCMANDFGYEHAFARQVKVYRPDVVIAVSSSGKSANIIAAVVAGHASAIISLTGFVPDNPLRQHGDLALYVPSYDYGIVEVAHQLILHNITDRLKAMSKAVKVAAE